MRTLITTLATAALAGSALASSALAQDKPFYEGKTISFIVGYAAGGGSDLSCRVFANHMGQHIAGNPTIIVKNMPGAGGLNAINFVGEAARNDGLTALCGTVSIMAPLIKDPALRVDLKDFAFIAGVADSQVFFVRSDIEPGIKDGQDIFDAKGLIYGGFRVDSAKDLPARMYLDLMGVDYKYVTGINGDGAGRAAIQQNFVNGWMEGLASYVSITDPTLVKTGEVVPLFQSGLLDDQGQMTEKDPAVPDVPTFIEFYQKKFGKMPEGPKWDAVNVILGTYAASQRSIALAPGAPQEAIDAMRAAVEPTLADEAFQEEAKKVLGEGVQIFGADRVQKAFMSALEASDETVATIREMIESGNAATRQ